MPYLDYYGNCIEDTLDAHICQNCLDQTEEHAGIRRGAWVHKNRYAAIAADPTNAAVWQAGIDANEIIILPELRGTYDGGTAVFGAGWGDSKQTYTGSSFKATISDRVYQDNWPHYRSLVGKNNWHLVFLTETQGHITGKTVTVAPKPIVTDNTEDVVFWQSEVSWSEYFSPSPFLAPLEIFACIPT